MKKQLLLGLLAVGMLAACSNEESLDESKTGQYHMVPGQSAFLSLGIAMPSGDFQTTRANDNFNDGETAEYNVYSGKLVLFKGANEATATLFKAYDIPVADLVEQDKQNFPMEGTTAQITSTSKKYVQEIEAPNLGAADALYAYVILNQDGNATDIDLSEGQKFSDFSKKVLKAIGIKNEAKGYGEESEKGLVMTSVPYSTTAGGTKDASAESGYAVKTLTKIDANAVYETKAEAESESANVACLYVERAAVKVEVVFNAATINGTELSATLEGWCLGNTNYGGNDGSGYYNTRQVDAKWASLNNPKNATAATKYRFICDSPFFASGHEMGYRTYFGQDVNYDGKTGLINAQVLDGDHTLANNKFTYTYENTFNENCQIYANTTYVSFKTKLNGGSTFWTVKGEDNTAITDENTLKAKLANNIDNQISATSTAFNKIQAAINADLALGEGVSKLMTAGLAAGQELQFTLGQVVTLGTKNTDAIVPYTSKVAFKSITVSGSPAGDDIKTALNGLIYEGTTTIGTALAADLTGYTPDVVTEYTNGITYYATRIAHFGNSETPWSTGAESYNQYDKIYPMDGQSVNETSVNYGTDRANAWLGRWGIVRNNWYVLNVTSITGIGDAVPVDYSGTGTGTPGGTPDDNPEPKYYIAAHIHIVPWVKRTQDVILK